MRSNTMLRKRHKFVPPPLQRAGGEPEIVKTGADKGMFGQPENQEYWLSQCSRCFGRYWYRAIPNYGTKCAKCWNRSEAQMYWRSFWRDTFSMCLEKGNLLVKHKSPSKEALQTLREVHKFHPALPIDIILDALTQSSLGPNSRYAHSRWVEYLYPLVEALLNEPQPKHIQAQKPVVDSDSGAEIRQMTLGDLAQIPTRKRRKRNEKDL